jgi:hypothetical protein
MPRYQRPRQQIDPYKSQPLPLGRPVAVYYRQSSEGQIGNISTTLQTVDVASTPAGRTPKNLSGSRRRKFRRLPHVLDHA